MTNNNINRIGLSLGSTPSSPIPIPNMAPEKSKRATDKDTRQVPPPPPTPTPPPPPAAAAAAAAATVVKKACVEMSDAQVNEIVEMLGTILAKVKQAISDKKGNLIKKEKV